MLAIEAGIPGCNGGGGGGADSEAASPLPEAPLLMAPLFPLLSVRRGFGAEGAVDRKDGDEEEDDDLCSDKGGRLEKIEREEEEEDSLGRCLAPSVCVDSLNNDGIERGAGGGESPRGERGGTNVVCRKLVLKGAPIGGEAGRGAEVVGC